MTLTHADACEILSFPSRAKPRPADPDACRSMNRDFGSLADQFGTHAKLAGAELAMLSILTEPELIEKHMPRCLDELNELLRIGEIARREINRLLSSHNHEQEPA